MCGFAGFVDSGTLGSTASRDVLHAMAGTLEHRGPDDEGYWHADEVGLHLGFRRLAILDLSSAGHQPMTSPSGRYVIVFNGEVYNFRALRSELMAVGFSFKGHSDTEVLLAAFERWGPRDATHRFRGMFAFALWDSRERELWLARDRMGIKPLFVARKGSALIFGSELRALLAHPLVEGRGDRASAWHFLRNLYVPGPASILEGVEKLPPGNLVRFAVGPNGAVEERSERFWDLAEVARTGLGSPLEEAQATEELHELLRESVRLRLVADVPVGALLSGGIDSSLLVALMAEQASEPVRTFTISFEDQRFDEGPIAAEVAGLLGARHTQVDLSTDLVRDLVPNLSELTDEPLANPSILPTLLVCEVARRDVVVALSGDGGDELFGGYNRYRSGPSLMRLAGRMPKVLRPALRRLARGVASAPGLEAIASALQPSGYGSQHSFSARLARAAGILGAQSDLEAYLELVAVGHPDPPMTAPDGRAILHTRSVFDAIHGTLAERMMLLDQREYLVDDLLAKVDRASMRASLEARVPLLDHEVVAFSWRLPEQLKIRNGTSKFLLRELACRYLPRDLLERPKMGFTVPIASWLEQDLAEWLGDTLASKRLAERDLLDPEAVSQMHERFRAGERDLALPLWALAVLEDWCTRWDVEFR